jgi:hypothetical protein
MELPFNSMLNIISNPFQEYETQYMKEKSPEKKVPEPAKPVEKPKEPISAADLVFDKNLAKPPKQDIQVPIL